MQTKVVVGIDVGTSGCKVIAIDESGKLRASHTETYPLYTPQAGWSEQQPEDWWKGVCNCTKRIMAELEGAEVAGIGMCGQMHGMTALDKDMRVVRKAILWNDQRTQKQCDGITEAAGGRDGLLKLTNNRMLTGYTGGKIIWMREMEPENFAKTRLILNPKDYIRLLLTGEAATEVSDASGTGLFDVKARCWQHALMEKLNLDKDLFPDCVESAMMTGRVTAAAADATGLPEGAAVYGGGGDAVISTIGMGLMPGKVGVTLGTSGVVATGLDGFRDNPDGLLQVFCNNAPGLWNAMGVTLAAAGSYQWLRNTLGDAETREAQEKGASAYELLDGKAAASQPGAGGIVFLPYLMGERCPMSDPDARGAFIGLTQMHGKGDMVRAVLEGVTFSLKQVYGLMQSMQVEGGEVILAGGGSRSALWRQIFADVFQLPVRTVYGSAEGGSFGAALVAGVGCGMFASLKEACALAAPISETLPNTQNRAVYEDMYALFDSLYGVLCPAFSSLAGRK